MKTLYLILLALVTLWSLYLDWLDRKAADNPVPLNVIDVYDRKTYRKWQAYHKEHVRLSAFEHVFSFAVMFVLIHFNLYAHVSPTEGVYLPILVVVFFDSLVWSLLSAIFSYIRMTIEERYGFNKSTLETFAEDQIKEFAIGFLISFGLLSVFAALHRALGDWILVVFLGILVLFMLAVTFLYPYFSKIFNKFTPLEEGELRDKLRNLLEKHGYKVRDIVVMDASRRTTKANAYFTGFGKTKTIVLYDTLLEKLTPEEICAVFAHEVGHGLHKDTLRNQIVNLGNMAALALLMWLHVYFAGSCAPFGFENLNYAFAFILVGNVYMPIFTAFYDVVTFGMERKAEYRADRQAAEEGYAAELISALKKISRDNFGCLSPHPLTVKLTYSHPTLSQRISALEKGESET